MSDSVGSVSVTVVPDARGWSEKLRAQIRDTSATVNVDADTAEANAQLDEAARTRTAKIKTDVSQFSQGASKLDQFIGNLSLLPTLAITAGAALVPLGAALGGVTAALAAPLLIAGGGVTLFGFLAAFAAKNTNEQLKNIDKLQQKLGTLTKGSKDYAQTARQLKTAQAALSPAQTQFAKSLDGIKSAFDGLLQGKTGQALLGPLSEGMDILAKVLPRLAPVITSVSGALSTLLGDISDGVSTPGFDKFIRTFSGQVGGDIVSFGRIAGNGIKGLVGILGALDGTLSGGVLKGLERLSGNFADLGTNAKHSKGFQDFIAYFHQVGPQVADTLGSVARSIGHIVKALAPLGPPVLSVIKGVADAFNRIPIPVLTALAGATAGLVALGKVGGLKLLGVTLGKSGTAGGPAGVLSRATGVVPVFVTNEGFGRGGAPGVPGTGTRAPGVPVAGAPSVGLVLGGTAALAGVTAGTGALAKKLYGDTLGSVFANIQSQLLGGIPQFHPKAVGQEGKILGALLSGNLDEVGSLLNQRGDFGLIPKKPNLDLGAAPKIGSAIASGFHAFLNIGADKPPDPKPIKSLGTAYEALRQHVADASREMDQIGPHGANAAKKAGGAIDHLGSRLNAVDGSKAEQQLDLVGHAANRIPPNTTVKVTANTGPALSSIRSVFNALTGIDGKTATTYVRTVSTHNTPGIVAPHHKAGGGLISGPGGPTSDSIPTWLSNGEFVVNAATTRQHRQLLEQLNRGSYRAPQYAAAGYAPRGGSGAASGPAEVHLHIQDGPTLRGYIQGQAQGVYEANSAYDGARAGR